MDNDINKNPPEKRGVVAILLEKFLTPRKIFKTILFFAILSGFVVFSYLLGEFLVEMGSKTTKAKLNIPAEEMMRLHDR